jgi:hypothetical protein
VEGKKVGMVALEYGHPIKTKKHNIDTEEAPKMVIIVDYWDKDIFTHVIYVLKKYKELFPWIFSNMNGIIGSLGDMKINLKIVSKTISRRPYRLNPK